MRALSLTATLLLLPAVAAAHFPYIHLEGEGKSQNLHAYFGHGVEKTAEKYFNRLEGAKVARVDASGGTRSLSLAPADGSLASGPVPAGDAAYVFEKDQGVVSHNGTYRLTNYAKAFSGPEAWTIDTSKQLRLDLQPQRNGDDLLLTVRWEGEPLAGASVVVELGKQKQEGKTDAEGRFTAKLAGPGIYAARAWRIDETSGERDGKEYEDIRYYSTLLLDIE